MSDSIERHAQSERDLDAALRQLALVDRIIGLQAEVAHLSMTGPGAAMEMQREIEAIRSTTTWRAGRIVLSPLIAARWLVRKVLLK